ncbi:GNAT family N-acetyltransferase [Algoriphagus mannitolivorans]|uniref:GNAT family N-acetyltransferase n=1 Tax=Algoriphagus mannitolivorans TaxID=226504 RepID=UPI00040A2B5B|nr:GNAT family N-acetyltransferase [Algoriphagus mannitolivorans]
MTLIFRKATPNDVTELWALIEPIIRQGGTYVFSPDSSREKMMSYWLQDDKHTYVAEWEGEIVGTLYLKANQPDLGDHICNAGFMVSSQYGGKGFGKAMGKFALVEAKNLGFQAMQFNFVVESNVHAVRLWRNLGFQEIGKIPEAYRHPELGLVSALILYRKL